MMAFLEARGTEAADLHPAEQPHDNLGPNFNVAIWVLTGAALVFMSLRLYCKIRIRRGLWWDDYVLILAMGMLLTQTSMLSVCVHYGFGKHSWDITDWPTYLYVNNITGVCSIVAAAWSKSSFAITLLRFTQGWKRGFVWFVLVTVNLFLGLSALFTFIQCTPIPRLWDSSVDGHCWNSHVIVTYNSFSSSWSGAADICLALLPWTIISRKTLNKKERLGVLLAMSTGIVAGLTSIAKTATLGAISNPDTIATVALMTLATAEIALSIIASSIPALRVLIKNTMNTHSVPRFYEYYRTNTPASQAIEEHTISRPSAVMISGRKSSQFSDSLSSPNIASKWPEAQTRSFLNSETDFESPALELQSHDGQGPTSYDFGSVRGQAQYTPRY